MSELVASLEWKYLVLPIISVIHASLSVPSGIVASKLRQRRYFIGIFCCEFDGRFSKNTLSFERMSYLRNYLRWYVRIKKFDDFRSQTTTKMALVCGLSDSVLICAALSGIEWHWVALCMYWIHTEIVLKTVAKDLLMGDRAQARRQSLNLSIAD